jgi:hypothetical protein
MQRTRKQLLSPPQIFSPGFTMKSMRALRALGLDAVRQPYSRPARSCFSQSPIRAIHFNTQSTFCTRPVKQFGLPFRSRAKFPDPARPFRRFQSTHAGPTDSNLSLSQRLRKLFREYGWSALGVYLALTALDFPFCFLAVRYLGTDRIGHWEHVMLSYIKSWIKWPLPQQGQDVADGAASEVKRVMKEHVPGEDVREVGQKRILEEEPPMNVQSHGYKEAEKANMGENASTSSPLY